MIGRSGANNAGNTAVTAVNYNTRQSSVMQYWTSNISGFQGKIAYSPSPDSGQTATQNGCIRKWWTPFKRRVHPSRSASSGWRGRYAD